MSAGEVFTVVSGKGGVGKTNLALNLAINLARRRRRVILLDADFGLANADILLNVSPLADFSALLDPRRPVDDVLVEGPAGMRLLCGVSGVGQRGAAQQFDSQECQWAIKRLQQECDTLLIDCGAGMGRTIETFGLASDLLIVTTTPEPTALADSYATLKILSNQGFCREAGVVVNMTRSDQEAARVAQRFHAVASRFLGLSVTYLGGVVVDRHVPLAVRARVPVSVKYPHCPASRCIARISARIVEPARSLAGRCGIWSRVAGLFL